MKQQNLKTNFIFQVIYQILILVIPLITAPYLTRTLGDTSLGIYSYSYSIAYYFVIFAMLGISRHGQRIISARRNDVTALRKTFWSLYFVHTIVSIFSIIAYFLFIFLYNTNDKIIYYIQGIYVLSALFDITWLFYGLETFKSVVIRNAILKILECICVFTLVNGTNDLWIYTLIMCSSACLGQLVMFTLPIKKIKPIRFGLKDCKEHIKPLLVLFISVLAVSFYTVFDKILLGALATKEDVAYYEYSNKIINIPKSIIGVVGTIMFPRACYCYANNDFDGMKKYYNYSLTFTYLIGFGSIFGLLGVSNLFVNIYYGNEFAICGNVIKVMAPIIVIVALGDIIRTQYLIPMKKDFIFISSIILNAIINIIISTILIKYIGIYGAVIGTLVAELFGLVFQLIVCRKYISVFKTLLYSLPYIITGLIMLVLIYTIDMQQLSNLTIKFVLEILVGVMTYFILISAYLLLIDKNKNIYRNQILLIINKILKIKK